MSRIDELKAELTALPFAERIEMLGAIESSLSNELHKIDEHWPADDLAIVAQRFAEMDANPEKMIPWETVRRELFRNS